MAMKYLCSSVLLTVLMAMGTAYGETNLLENPGFENGTNGWAERSCKVEAVTTPVHSGSASAKVFGRAEEWQGIKQSLLGKVSNGNTYKISAWVRLENADTDTVTVSIEQGDESGTKYFNVKSGAATKDEWLHLEGDFTPNMGNNPKTLDIYFEGPVKDVNFFVDDVSVINAGPATPAEPNKPKTEPNAPPKEGPMTSRTAETQTVVLAEPMEVNTRSETAIREKN
jgi:hypothetical protein